MTDSILTVAPPMIEVKEASIRAFAAEQAAHLAPATVERYEITTNALFTFLDTVDIEPRLGPQIAEHLEAARSRLESAAFLPTLGVVSMIRMFPDFLDDPWLTPTTSSRSPRPSS